MSHSPENDNNLVSDFEDFRASNQNLSSTLNNPLDKQYMFKFHPFKGQDLNASTNVSKRILNDS